MSVHGKQLERMAANADWVRVSGDLSRLCNRWAGRKDLRVYLGRDGGAEVKAPAFFNPRAAQIELNSELAFGKGSNGATVGDLTKRLELSKYPVAGGMAMHESGHARYMNADWAELRTRFPGNRQWTVYELLEETRIEGRIAQVWPKDVSYLRACTREIVMGEDVTRWNPRGAAQLFIGRHEVGVLQDSDIWDVEFWLLSNGWTEEILTRVREITAAFMVLDDVGDELEQQIELALELDTVMPLDPMTVSEQLQEILEGAISSAARGGRAQAVREGTREAEQERIAEREQDQRIQEQNMSKAMETFMNSGGGRAKVPSALASARAPREAEKGAAVQLSKALKRAKYRDRSLVEFDSQMPPGRFNGGQAMQAQAARTMGGDPSRYKPFRHRRYQIHEEPPLTVGIMSDVSGSMSGVQAAIGVANWVISDAVYRLTKATAASVYFGERVYPGMAKGERLDSVRTWNGNDGSEHFDGGFRALDGELTLLEGTGARLLVVASDGQYGGAGQAEARDHWVKTCVKKGVGVVWLRLRGQKEPVASGPGIEIVEVGTDILAAIEPIGQACIRALEHASGS